MDTQQTPLESAEVARFYDAARGSPLSAALVHGEAYIGQEYTLTAEEIAAFAGQAGMTAGTWVLDVGSGPGVLSGAAFGLSRVGHRYFRRGPCPGRGSRA
jgi:hypothetical protein